MVKTGYVENIGQDKGTSRVGLATCVITAGFFIASGCVGGYRSSHVSYDESSMGVMVKDNSNYSCQTTVDGGGMLHVVCDPLGDGTKLGFPDNSRPTTDNDLEKMTGSGFPSVSRLDNLDTGGVIGIVYSQKTDLDTGYYPGKQCYEIGVNAIGDLGDTFKAYLRKVFTSSGSSDSGGTSGSGGGGGGGGRPDNTKGNGGKSG